MFLQDVLVEAQIGHKLLQLPVLVLKLLETTELDRPKLAEEFLPTVERLLRDPIRRSTSATGVPSPPASTQRRSAP